MLKSPERAEENLKKKERKSRRNSKRLSVSLLKLSVRKEAGLFLALSLTQKNPNKSRAVDFSLNMQYNVTQNGVIGVKCVITAR